MQTAVKFFKDCIGISADNHTVAFLADFADHLCLCFKQGLVKRLVVKVKQALGKSEIGRNFLVPATHTLHIYLGCVGTSQDQLFIIIMISKTLCHFSTDFAAAGTKFAADRNNFFHIVPPSRSLYYLHFFYSF